MEHIVQFAISIDDDAIKKRIEDSAYNDIIDKLTEKAIGSLRKHYYANRFTKDEDLLRKIYQDAAHTVANERYEDIVKQTVTEIESKFSRSKKYKELRDEIAQEIRKEMLEQEGTN